MGILHPVVRHDNGELIGYNHWCPGCDSLHFIPIKIYRADKKNPVWSFNSDFERPTFNPSIRIFHPEHMDEGVKIPEETLCHYFIRSGNIEFCSDSKHGLAGKSVRLGNYEKEYPTVTDSNTQFLNQLEEMGGGKSQAEPTGDGESIQYTSHPIKTYKIGKWRFENALLTLENADEEAEFLKTINHKNFPERERHMIRKLDHSAAERISREYREKQGGATKQIDSTIGERADKSPKIGSGDLLESHRKREELGMEAATEGGREMNVPGAPDSNRETQTEPSPQDPPETPFRAEERGQGGKHSLEQLEEEAEEGTTESKTPDEGQPVKDDTNAEPPAVEAVKGFGKPLLAGTPRK